MACERAPRFDLDSSAGARPLLFFYGKVLCVDLSWMNQIGRPRPTRRLPVVLTPEEVARILAMLEGEHRLFAQLLYGTGMRTSEGLQLRVKGRVPALRARACRRVVAYPHHPGQAVSGL